MKLRHALSLTLVAVFLLGQFLPGTSLAPRPVAAATSCDWAQFIADVTVPDGTSFMAGASFVKTWRLKNIGSCTWTSSYAAIFYSGTQMSAPATVNLPNSVAPGASVDISINMIAPLSAGHYRGYWRLRNAAGMQFGIGVNRTATFFVDINVTASSNVTTAYDFVSNYCSASWSSGAGGLPCPGADGDAKGFVLKVDSPRLENGNNDTNPGLSIGPQKVAGGYIQGIYPVFAVQAGDHFQSIINCAYQATGCYVNFRLEYQTGSSPVKVFWTFNERYDGLFYRADLDLSSLAGQSVKFILYMSDVVGHGTPSGDKALWGGARLVRAGSGPAPTTGPNPTVSPQPTTPATNCDLAMFVTDVTVPDGTTFAAGASFTKTWRIKNAGVCTWTSAYAAVFSSGNQMSAPAAVNLPGDVAPGSTVDISVNMVAPSTPGRYLSYWKLRNPSGTVFGLGTSRTGTFFADINVASTVVPTATFSATSTGIPPTATSTTGGVPPTAIPPTAVPPTAVPPTPTLTKTTNPSACVPAYNGAFEQQVLLLINAERSKAGLVLLTVNSALEISAGLHSDDMSINHFMSHTGSDGSTYWDREVRAGYTGHWGGEIIYAGSGSYNTPEHAVAWWMNDPPHKAVILADYNDFGAGYSYCPTSTYGAYFTVDFGHR